jgi:hypothetical protein
MQACTIRPTTLHRVAFRRPNACFRRFSVTGTSLGRPMGTDML